MLLNNKNKLSEYGKYVLSSQLSLNKRFYRHIDKIYKQNSDIYDNYAKKSSYYKSSEDKLLESEIYFKRMLGIFEYGEMDDAFFIVKMSYKKAYHFIKNSIKKEADIRLIDFLKLNKSILGQDDIIENIYAVLFLGYCCGKTFDKMDPIYIKAEKTFENSLTAHTLETPSYSLLSKEDKRKVDKVYEKLKEIFDGFEVVVPPHALDEVDELDQDSVEIDRFARYIIYSYYGGGIDLVLLKDYIDEKDREKYIKDSICYWYNSDEIVSVDEIKKIDKNLLSMYFYSSLNIRVLLEKYKEVKNLYFENIEELNVNKLREKEKTISKITQEKLDIQSKYNKIEIEYKDEVERLKEEIRILKNENNSLKKEVDSYPLQQEELNELRNLMFRLSDDIDLSTCNKSFNTVDVESINSLNAICMGGTSNWISSMKEKLPNWTFVAAGVENYDTALLKDRDYIFINTTANTHGMYYRTIKNKDKNTKLRYINNLNTNRVLQEIQNSL